MGAVRQVPVELKDPTGRPCGTLHISLLPKAGANGPAPLLDLRSDPDRDPTLEPIQVLEGTEYVYEVKLDADQRHLVIEPELFEPDTDTGHRGRLKTGLHTGALPVVVKADGVEVGQAALEVRSRKLEYLSHYRWMLRDVADGFAEIIMERFAPTEQTFKIDEVRDAATLYQRFVFLKSLITGETFEAAIGQVLSRPHRTWTEQEEFRHPGQGLPPTSRTMRELTKAGPRVDWEGGDLESLPMRVLVERTEETLDNQENRFVKFALTHWRDVIAEFGRHLAGEKDSRPVQRGRTEVAAVLDYLDSLLSADLFREVGDLTQFPAGSQVLQKRAGYRDIFRAYIQFEAAAALTWDGGEDVYGAGQRDVATLYEFWVFLQLAEAVSRLCQEPLDRRALVVEREDGYGIGLKRGRMKVLDGLVARLGRKLHVQLWYNKSFAMGAGSWTRPMQPDCSLLIEPAPGSPGFEPVWVHFDAKYRVESLTGLFGKTPGDDEAAFFEEERQAEEKGTPKRADLLKMHAYRDAIRRSAGAYVVYPGTEEEERRLYHEILPGLGAFALRPAEGGDAEGLGTLQRFIDDVLTHVASQVTQHERGRWWDGEAFRETTRDYASVPAAPFLTRPPADSPVLLAFVRNARHLQWILAQRRYNLRADQTRNGSIGIDSHELAAEFVLLCGLILNDRPQLWRVAGAPEIYSQERMEQTGYAKAIGTYFCLPLAELIDADEWLRIIQPKGFKSIRHRLEGDAPFGTPVLTTWWDLVTRTEK